MCDIEKQFVNEDKLDIFANCVSGHLVFCRHNQC